MKTRADRITAPAPVPRKPVKVTGDLWAECLVCGGIAGLVLLLGAWLIPARVSLPLEAGTLGAVAVISGAVTFISTRAVPLSSWVLACGAFAAGWTAAARLLGAWSQDVLFWLAAGTVILAAAGPLAIGHYQALDTRDPDADERERQKAERGKWQAKFAQWGVRGVTVTSIMPMGSQGVEVYGLLGGATDEHGIVTFDRLKSHADVIVTDLQVAPGGVSFTQPDPDNAAAFVMHLRTRKGKRDVKPLPERTKWTSINKKLRLGLPDSAKEFPLLLREIAVVIVGAIKAGKSNLLGVFIGELAWCEDAIVFCIDLKGGRMARPWIMPWLENPPDENVTPEENVRRGKVLRPVIDWLATTRPEAKLMLETLIAAGDARARYGAGGEKITPRRDLPAVVVIVDESAIATGHNRKDDGVKASEIAVLLARLVETYRSEAITPVISAIRGDVETLGLSAIKAQALCRIGMKVGASTDGDRIFQDDHVAAAALTKITDPGVGLVQLDGKVSEPVHFYRLTPKIAYGIAKRTGARRPRPDPRLEAAMGEAYANRWKRMEALTEMWLETAQEWKRDPKVDITDDGPVTTVAPGDSRDEDDTDRQFLEIVSQIPDPEDARGRKGAAKRRMRELLRDAGKDGMRVGDIVKALCSEAARTGNTELTAHRNSVHKWLNQEMELGRVRHEDTSWHDPWGRWIWIRQASDDDPDLGPPGIEVDL